MADLLAIIGSTLGRPGLRYVQTSAAEARAAMLGAGISANVAGLMMEVVAGINSGALSTTQPRSTRTSTATSYESFVADEWLPAFLSKASG